MLEISLLFSMIQTDEDGNSDTDRCQIWANFVAENKKPPENQEVLS